MKVKELIEVLKELNGEMKIVVVDGNEYEYSLMSVREMRVRVRYEWGHVG